MKITLSIIFVAIFFTSFSQDYLNYSPELLVSRLTDLGFEEGVDSKKQLKIDSVSVTALFNTDKCSKIEYFINQHDESCDSILFNSTCSACFASTLDLFIKSRRRNWRKESSTVFYSVKDPWKEILFGPPRKVSYNIVKLVTVDESSFYIYRVMVTKEEYKQLRKRKKYH